MKRNRLILLSLILWLGGSAQIAMAEVEDWYTYWGIGFANHTYEDQYETLVKLYENQPNSTRTQTAYDLLGFYWPFNNGKTMGGFVVSGTADRIESSWTDAQFNQYLYAGSVMHFFGKEIGDGFFLRGDLGFAKSVFDTSYSDPAGSDTGNGILLGVGYGIPISQGTRILISLTSSHNHIDGHDFSATALRIGGLW